MYWRSALAVDDTTTVAVPVITPTAATMASTAGTARERCRTESRAANRHGSGAPAPVRATRARTAGMSSIVPRPSSTAPPTIHGLAW